ncbi:C-C chemokine receptor type 4 [Genypterus blacodes]|uniref:C-C chemokine receptor type 4 n=1 Tax=Genypterus blacodes TaxID=154954 RepID=UPI003F769208
MNSTDYDYVYDDCDMDSSPLSDGSRFLPVLLYLLFCLGTLGNIAVIWVLLRHIRLKTMTDIFLLNLAMSDLILALSLPLWAYSFHNHQGFNGDLPCKLMTGIYQLGLYSGTLFVTIMSVDRYLAIVHAVAAMRARTRCLGTAGSVAVWVISVAMAIPQVTFAAMETDGGDNGTQHCRPQYPTESVNFWKMLRNLSENTVGLFVCLPIIIFCYVKILIVVQRSRNSNKHKAIKMIFAVVCVFVVCWVPYNVIVFVQTLELYEILFNCDASKTLKYAMSVAETIALSHCCVNPVIYAFVGEKFRKSLSKVLPRSLRWNQQLRVISSHNRDTAEKETSNTPVKSDY